MTHQDRVNLIKAGVGSPAGLWADLGSGEGAFTLALAELLHPPAEIYSIEKDQNRLNEQKQEFRIQFPDLFVHFIRKDFTRDLRLPPLDGIIMANSLHYISNKKKLIRRVRSYLKNQGYFLLVEYHVKQVNPWVPHPISFKEWNDLAKLTGFRETRLIGTHPSRYQHEIYAALSQT
ncbi:MAG: methyltransferase domain-containing protein [bacterium]|nr:MAG: methyltransferase domain-containing protein [bacterium]